MTKTKKQSNYWVLLPALLLFGAWLWAMPFGTLPADQQVFFSVLTLFAEAQLWVIA